VQSFNRVQTKAKWGINVLIERREVFMRKQRIEHNCALDALITMSKRLNGYEMQHKMAGV
jgi:hypothetical protein